MFHRSKIEPSWVASADRQTDVSEAFGENGALWRDVDEAWISQDDGDEAFAYFENDNEMVSDSAEFGPEYRIAGMHLCGAALHREGGVTYHGRDELRKYLGADKVAWLEGLEMETAV